MLRVAPSGELTMVCSITEDMAFGSKALLVEKGTKKLAVVRFDSTGKLLVVIAGASDPRTNPQVKLPAGKLPFSVLLQKLAAPGTTAGAGSGGGG